MSIKGTSNLGTLNQTLSSLELSSNIAQAVKGDELIRNYKLADWIYEKLKEQIREFESQLDDNTEVSLLLASFGASVAISVREISYQNPYLIYFKGYVNGKPAQLIQHINELNFLMTTVPKRNPSKPANRIGFISD